MKFVRRNVWNLGDDWAEEILWYARGVAAMKTRALADPTSWRFYAGMHGFNAVLWNDLGYLSPTDQPPSQQLIDEFWDQCQHQSWYFLPWHRGYLWALEANIRAEVVALGGPENWALPYWNYFGTNQAGLPPAFGSPDWPDGDGDNPLFVEQRYGPFGDGNVFVPTTVVNLNAMAEPDFTGVSGGGSSGFGGVDTGFMHSGDVQGGIENQPHNITHGAVGGRTGQPPRLGVMSRPATAGLDPIFYLHHANIDRLWASWNRDSTHLNPTDARWLGGPASTGERPFCAPMPDGSTFVYTPEMMTLQALEYEYDSLAPAAAEPAATGAPGGPGLESAADEGVRVPRETDVELVGANDGEVSLEGRESRTVVQLDAQARAKVSSSRTPSDLESMTLPDRVFLNIENVRGQADATLFSVYVGLGDDEDPGEHPERLAGSIAPFGVSEASDPEGEHAGQGQRFALDITDIVDQLHLEGNFDVASLSVRLVPLREVEPGSELRIGRISVFRQGR